jgi:DNA-binding GntR family transcriptional regulator
MSPLDSGVITVEDLFAELREQILSGELPEGTVLSQVKLAERFGVNRTPLREALRMLQREGLIHAQYNRRVQVSRLSTADLEDLYAQRIVTEALGIRLTVPTLDPDDIGELRELLAEMNRLATAESFGAWETVHHRFHVRLIAGAGAGLVRRAEQLTAYARRYRFALAGMGVHAVAGFAQGATEHEGLVDACEAGDVDRAGRLMARHLARTALTLMSVREPTHDPATVRGAVRMVVGDPHAGS